MKQRKTLIGRFKLRRPQLIIIAVVIACFAAAGLAALHFSRASTPVATTETENGSIKNGATVVTDSTASGGKALKYSSSAVNPPLAGITKPCGNPVAAPATYDHVVWIYEENHAYNHVIDSGNAPYISSMAHACGSSTNYYDNEPIEELDPTATTVVAHSRYIYVANSAGSLCLYGNGIHGTDCFRSLTNDQKLNLPWKSIFQQVDDVGKSWRVYEESATTGCQRDSDAGLYYHADHNPMKSFSSLQDQCNQDVPTPGLDCPGVQLTCNGTPTGPLANDIKNGTLPSYAAVIPNGYNQMHNGTVQAGDAWLKAYLGLITGSTDYKRGKTAVFVIWDEPFSLVNPTMPFLAVAPSLKPGIVSNNLNSFAILRATEDMLGIKEHLGCATGSPPHADGQPAPTGSSCFRGALGDVRTIYGM